MKKPIVIDVSMAASWVMPDEQSDVGRRLLRELRLAPFRAITVPLFWFEFCNILLTNERRGRISKSDGLESLATVHSVRMKVQDVSDHYQILSLARAHELSAYDAAYLALAMRAGAVLATNDKKLARAAINADVELRTALTPLQM